MSRRRDVLAAAAGGLAAALGCPSVTAQASPVLRIVAPYAAGGTTDDMARLLAAALPPLLGQSVIVENRPGASGLLAIRQLQGQPADGQTLMLTNEGFLITPLLQKKPDYDALREFLPVSLLARSATFLMVSGKVPANTLPEFIAYAKSQPKGIEAANSGLTSSGYLQTLMFARAAGLGLVHVPYKGAAETFNALLANQVQMQISTYTGAVEQQVRQGALKVLATLAPRRLEFLPSVPSMSETLAGMEVVGWFGLVAREGSPPAEIRRIHAAVTGLLRDEGIRNRFHALKMEAWSASLPEFGGELRRSREKWAQLITQENIPLS